MKRWIRGLAVAICLCAALFAQTGLADVAEWAREQTGMSFAEMRIANQREALGAEVNTAIKAQDITKKCAIRVSSGEREKLTNGRVSDGWSYGGRSGWVELSLPEGAVPGAIRIEWRFDPTGFELVEYGADGSALRARTLADTFPGIYTMFALLPEARKVRLNMTGEDQVIVNLAVYSEGVLPNDVQTWLPPVEKADMMVFSTHQDDEVVFLGGAIPYSNVVCGRPTITVYMTNCSRNRRREALECLWAMGTRNYPEFINLEDKKVGSMKEGVRLWGGKDNILREMVGRIRRYKPEVIVTHDFNGEYGHNQHKIVAQAMPYAVQAAADPTAYPESFEAYGAWQVKKLYIHLYKENEIRMDWLTPQPTLGGMTLLKVAQIGMAKHASQTQYYSVKSGGEYDNARFGLYMSTVGEDAAKNDFFENIPRDASSSYLEAQREALAAADGEAQSGADPAEAAESADIEPDEGEAGPFDEGEAEIEIAAGEDVPADDGDVATDVGPTAAPSGGGNAVPAAKGAAQKGRSGGAAAVALIGAGIAAAGFGAWQWMRLGGRRSRSAGRARARSARRAQARTLSGSAGGPVPSGRSQGRRPGGAAKR